MDAKEKMKLLEDVLEVDQGSLRLDDRLDALDSWDSVSKLSLIVMIDDTFGKVITGNDIAKFQTIGDIIKIME